MVEACSSCCKAGGENRNFDAIVALLDCSLFALMFAVPYLPMPTNAVSSRTLVPIKQRPPIGAVEFKSRGPDATGEAKSRCLLPVGCLVVATSPSRVYNTERVCYLRLHAVS